MVVRPYAKTLAGTVLVAAALGMILFGPSETVAIAVFCCAAATAQFVMRRGRALLFAERRPEFRLLFANNPLPMWVYDVETLRSLEANEAAVARYGYSRAEMGESSGCKTAF